MLGLLQELTIATGLGSTDLLRIIYSAPKRYKQYTIPKRSGGFRLIAQPSRELKTLQRFVMSNVLRRFPVHGSAMAYVSGKGISDNARIHRRNPIILKLDFENFFPSIRVIDWKRFLDTYHPTAVSKEDSLLVTYILFWGQKSGTPKCLSIGAPTSPMLSNILLFELDKQISRIATETGTIYTRYADDITISGRDIGSVISCEKAIRKVVAALRSPRLKFNDDKRGLYTKGQKRMVTGLILTPTGQVSIGRERKREISALTHRFSLGQLDIERIGYLKGMLAFANANEPAFLERLGEKYGSALLKRIASMEIPRADPSKFSRAGTRPRRGG
jgi:RNA-directed DNA polymerase